MDSLKTDAPFWKREQAHEGARMGGESRQSINIVARDGGQRRKREVL